MFSRQITRRVSDVKTQTSRCMATLIATEEFASTPAVTHSIRAAPLITESTLASGIKIISRDTGAPVRQIFNLGNRSFLLCIVQDYDTFIYPRLLSALIRNFCNL